MEVGREEKRGVRKGDRTKEHKRGERGNPLPCHLSSLPFLCSEVPSHFLSTTTAVAGIAQQPAGPLPY